jgi:hypothetical protein
VKFLTDDERRIAVKRLAAGNKFPWQQVKGWRSKMLSFFGDWCYRCRCRKRSFLVLGSGRLCFYRLESMGICNHLLDRNKCFTRRHFVSTLDHLRNGLLE